MWLRTNKGFTLIELLVVISIIGLLASVVLVSLNSARGKARDVRRMADFKQFSTALEMFYEKNGYYPNDVGWCYSSKGVVADNCVGFVGNAWQAGDLDNVVNQGFISKLPIDPKNDQTYFYYYEPVAPGQLQFEVNCPASSLGACGYIMSTMLEGTQNTNPGCNTCYPAHNYCVTGGGAKLNNPVCT